MYIPKYTITNNILTNIGFIEAAKEVVENAPLVPAFEKEFKSDALIRAVHHGTHVEGNDLSLSQTKKLLEGESIVARDRDIQEVINYRNVMNLIDDLKEKKGPYDKDMILEIYQETVRDIVPPDKTSSFRRAQVVIKEEDTGKVIMQPPSYIEVPYLVEDLLEWLNSEQAKEVHPVLKAGIVHYVLVSIHPFVEGNGRTTRAFATLVMLRENYNLKRFFALEEHFDNDYEQYYDALSKVDAQSNELSNRDLTAWLEYFTKVVAIELNKVKDKVRKISIDSKLRLKIGEQVALTQRQIKLVEYLSEAGFAVMQDLKNVIPMVSEDTILRDLKELLDKGIIKKEGRTKASRYVVTRN